MSEQNGIKYLTPPRPVSDIQREARRNTSAQEVAALMFVKMAQEEQFDETTISEHPDLFVQWDENWRGKLVYRNGPGDVQRRQDRLPADGKQLRQTGFAQGAQLHRALLQVGGGLLQGLCHGFRGTGRLPQQGGGLTAGLVGVEGEGLDLLKHFFYSLHRNFSFSLLVFSEKIAYNMGKTIML